MNNIKMEDLKVGMKVKLKTLGDTKEKKKKKKPSDFIFVEYHIIKKDFINGVSNKDNGCVIYMTDAGKLVLKYTSSKDVWKLLSK